MADASLMDPQTVADLAAERIMIDMEKRMGLDTPARRMDRDDRVQMLCAWSEIVFNVFIEQEKANGHRP